jgi:hypothetical protein
MRWPFNHTSISVSFKSNMGLPCLSTAKIGTCHQLTSTFSTMVLNFSCLALFSFFNFKYHCQNDTTLLNFITGITKNERKKTINS